MPYRTPSKRTDPIIDEVEDFLYELGTVTYDKEKGERVTIEGIEIDIAKVTRTGSAPMRLELHFDHPGAARYINKLKQTVWKELKQYYNMPYNDVMVKGYKALPFGYKSAGTYTILNFVVTQTKEVAKGAVPAPIQEEGTTIILNAALHDNVSFTTDDTKKNVFADGKPIREHKVYKALEKLFGNPYKHRIEDWLWTYYQQNKVFMNEYGKFLWDPFEFGDKDFVTFFEKHMKEMNRESGQKAGDYTTWNPSDIWAVKGMTTVRNALNQQLKKGTLVEMNNILINFMESNELMGISLKMVKSKSDAHVKLHNVEKSDILKDLKSFSKIEEYGMRDINFRYNNIWEGTTSYVPTQVTIGPGNKYEVNIRKAGNNIGFNTQIKGAPAQAGQTPTWMVEEWLNAIKLPDGKSFSKSHTDYPQDIDSLRKEALKYQEMYNLITKGKKAPSYEDFEFYMEGVYKKEKQVAVVKLMLLTFWYSTILKFSSENTNVKPYKKSAEFWTDLLYTGMKIKPGREFAPHAKIS